jgi:hypothetical protein
MEAGRVHSLTLGVDPEEHDNSRAHTGNISDVNGNSCTPDKKQQQD